MIKHLIQYFLYNASLQYITEPNRRRCGNKLFYKLTNELSDIDKITVRCTKQENTLKPLDDCIIIETMHGIIVYKREDSWHEFLMILDGTRYYFRCRSYVINTDLAVKRTALTFSRITFNLHRDYMAQDELR